MATENESNGSTDETSGQEQQGQQQEQGTETESKSTEQQGQENNEPIKLPEDHPLVKTLATQKQAIAAQKTELAEARAQAAKVTKLEDDLKARPTQEALDTLQTRNDRLEAFLSAVGGPLGKALDSRSFTKDLFESDKDVEEIVKSFLKANPTATSTALGSGAAEPGKGKINPNDLLRAARG